MDEEPLIFTSKGNLPISSLEYSHAWEDLETCIKFSETYTLEGEVVKKSCHVLMKNGQQITAELEQL